MSLSFLLLCMSAIAWMLGCYKYFYKEEEELDEKSH